MIIVFPRVLPLTCYLLAIMLGCYFSGLEYKQCHYL